MESLRPILEQQPFLEGLDPRYLELLVGCASNVRFAPDAYVFREGQPANSFYIIRAGCVSIETYAPGTGPIPIQTIGAGEVLGWSWVVPPYIWQFDARALEETRAIALDTTCLRDKCEEDHDLGYEIMKRFSNVIATRLRATHQQLVELCDDEQRKGARHGNRSY